MRPPHRIERPEELDADGYAVTVRLANGGTKEFSFRDLACAPYPQELLRTLIAAIAWACGPTGGWDSYKSAENGWSAVRRFIKYLAEAHPDVTTVDALTPEIWWDCRAMFLAATKYGTQVKLLRVLLRHCDSLPATTRVALRTKDGPPGRRKYAAYTRSEYARIWRVARRVFRLGRNRIRANCRLRDRYLAGLEPPDSLRVLIDGKEWTIGAICDWIANTGVMPPGGTNEPYTTRLNEALGVAKGTTPRAALFPTSEEIYAAMILFVCERGFNVSVLTRMRIGDGELVPSPSVRQRLVRLNIDKPRRGDDRHSSVTLVGREALLWEQTVAMTNAVRETLATLGDEEDHLFVAVSRRRTTAQPTVGFFTDWTDGVQAASRGWRRNVPLASADGEPIVVTLERLRLTEVVINGEPRQHSRSTNERVYTLPDPYTIEAARPTVLQGLNDALVDATQRVVARIVTDDDLDVPTLVEMFHITEEQARQVAVKLPAGQLGTATIDCADFEHSPHPDDAGGLCTASFLLCFACPNGILREARLPRVLALRRALAAKARSSSSAARENYYRRVIAQIDDALRQFPDETVDRHANAVTQHDVDQIMRLLNGGYDL